MPRIAAPPFTMTSSSRDTNDFRHIQSADQLYCELAACRTDERAVAVLRGYIAPRAEGKKACEKVLNEVEARFPQYSKSVQHVRMQYGIKPRRSATAQIRVRGAAPIRSATEPTPEVRPDRQSRQQSQPEPSSSRNPAPPLGPPPTGPGGLPPYSERDPDPASTMMLERRLASELNELGGLSGFCVESTDPDYLDALRDENEGRRFSAGEGGDERRPSAIEERNRNENAARRQSEPVLPVHRDARPQRSATVEQREQRDRDVRDREQRDRELRDQEQRERDRELRDYEQRSREQAPRPRVQIQDQRDSRDHRDQRDQRDQREHRERDEVVRPRELRREPSRSTRKEVRDTREAQLRDRRESREAQLRRPSGSHRRSAEHARRPSGNSIEVIQRHRRTNTAPANPMHHGRHSSEAATPASPASPTSPTSPTAQRTPPPLPPRPPPGRDRASSWLPPPPPLSRIDTASVHDDGPRGPQGAGSGSASPRSSSDNSPQTPVTPLAPVAPALARAPSPQSPPAYTTLDPRATTRSPPTTSLNVRPRRSLRNPSAPHAPPRLPSVNRLGSGQQRTMGDLMSDIVPVAGIAGPGLGLTSPSGYRIDAGEAVCVPAAISPLGEDMVIPASERYGERYAALAGNAHAAATGHGGRIKNLMKRWSGGNRRMAAA